MRIEVRTCSKVRVMLNCDEVESQRRIINGKSHHYQVKLDGGKILDLESPVPGVALAAEIDITKRSKYLTKLAEDKIDGKEN